MENPNFNNFSDEPPETDYSAPTTIAGRIQRGPGIGRQEAIKRAQQYAWYKPELKYDGRCKRWHIFRTVKVCDN